MLPGNTFASRYRLLKKIGVRGSAEVWQAIEETADNQVVALKIYAPERGMDDVGLKMFYKEFAEQLPLNHPHLLTAKHFDIWQSYPYLVLPYCSSGSLYNLLLEKGALQEAEIARVLMQVGSALAYIHEKNIIHKDVKPDNILIDKAGNFVLSDFGISTQLRNVLKKNSGKDNVLSMAYSPPERFGSKQESRKEGDVFAMGAMIYELCTGEAPWMGAGGSVLREDSPLPELPESYSKGLQNLMQHCLQYEPFARPSAGNLQAAGAYFVRHKKWPKPYFEPEKPAAKVVEQVAPVNDMYPVPFAEEVHLEKFPEPHTNSVGTENLPFAVENNDDVGAEYLPPSENGPAVENIDGDVGAEHLPPVESEMAPADRSENVLTLPAEHSDVNVIPENSHGPHIVGTKNLPSTVKNIDNVGAEYLPPSENEPAVKNIDDFVGAEHLPPVESDMAPADRSENVVTLPDKHSDVNVIPENSNGPNIVGTEHLLSTVKNIEGDVGAEYLPPSENGPAVENIDGVVVAEHLPPSVNDPVTVGTENLLSNYMKYKKQVSPVTVISAAVIVVLLIVSIIIYLVWGSTEKAVNDAGTTKYEEIISSAGKLMAAGDFKAALADYTSALEWCKDCSSATEGQVAANDSIRSVYSRMIAEGDAWVKKVDYKAAKQKYLEAKDWLPAETLADEKIAALDNAGKPKKPVVGELKNLVDSKGNKFNYKGEIRDGKPNGEGVATYPRGSVYKGMFKEGQREGYGFMTYLDGTQYLGEYRNNKYHGKGILIFPNGDKYEGQFRNGEKYKEGRFIPAHR